MTNSRGSKLAINAAATAMVASSVFSRSRRLGLIALILLLQACADSAYVRVVERPQPPTERINSHWVNPGETLYAIAWRYNMDPDTLARANGLRAPYRIQAGKKLSLDLSRANRYRSTASVSTSASSNTSKAASTSKTASTNRTSQSATAKQVYKTVGAWRWPVKGSVSKKYEGGGSAIHKGLDITGRQGQSVYAANHGVVVYAGSGLPAYGKLLIVKHNEVYLSAYAHNSKLTVSEGDKVKVGQKIAEIGKSGTTHEHLHFEIRKKGIPVDPLKVLPRV